MKPAGALLDLSGTLHVDDAAIPGAIAAVAQLRAAGIKVCAVSNTSRRTRASLAGLLEGMGFDFREDEILTAPLAARRWIETRNLRPWLLVHENLLPEFAGLDTRSPNAVLVADAGNGFSYENLNAAFRLLSRGAPLIATGVNRYFREGDALSLDAGPFVRALEFAAEIRAVLIGKPAREFFQTALDMLGCTPGAAVMIGDDAENDVAGAIHAGLGGILVRTGKYRDGDEAKAAGASCVADIREAVDRLLD
ncbi:MAG TPA: TIGR01458 family HAD-type hydrolase [Gammaproteobacteria bacterium]